MKVKKNNKKMLKFSTISFMNPSFWCTDEKVVRILPLMTQPYDFRTKKDIVPKWEELLLFNDDFEKIFQDNENVLMFFEVQGCGSRQCFMNSDPGFEILESGFGFRLHNNNQKHKKPII